MNTLYYLVKMGSKTKTLWVHVLGWVLFFALMTSFARGPENNNTTSFFKPSLLLFVLLFIVLFYLNLYLFFPKLYLQKKYWLYVTVSLLLFLGVCFVKPFDKLAISPQRFGRKPPSMFERREPPRFDEGPPKEKGRPGNRQVHIDIISMILFLSVWSASSALQILRQWRTTESRALQAEKDKVSAELSFLKAQINPHFLFNTLNNIYSLAITKSDKTADAVMKLSNILRYITDEVHNDLVPLRSEVDCVHDFIALQKLRLTDKVEVQFEVDSRLEGKMIAPLLLMTFIENAFKYGVSNHEHCIISIRITATDKEIELFCQNRVLETRSTEERVGVGISNAKKRLDYLYPNRYVLQIEKTKLFTVNLTLDA